MLLTDVANSIENPAWHEQEGVIRLAAERLREQPDTTPVIPKLVGELQRLATVCRDMDTRNSLLTLLGRLA